MVVNAMTFDACRPYPISDLIRIELSRFLSADFVIAGAISEILPGPDGGDYIRATVIFARLSAFSGGIGEGIYKSMVQSYR